MIDEQIDKKSIYKDRAIYTGIGFSYYLMIRIFVGLMLMSLPQWWEILLYLPILYPIVYWGYLGPLKKSRDAQAEAQSIDFGNALIHKPKKLPESFLLPTRNVFKVELDFENDTSLTEKLNSQLFNYYRTCTLKYHLQIELERGKGRADTNDILQIIREMDDLKTKFDKSEIKVEELNESLDLYIQKAEKEGIYIPKSEFNLGLKKTKKSGKFEDIDLSDIKQDIEILKSKYYYFARLDYECGFEDSEKFLWIFLILPEPYEKCLKTHKGDGSYDGWAIKIRECFCYYNYITKLGRGLPILLLKFSENMGDVDAEFIKNLKAKAFSYLLLKIMEVWINDLEVRPEALQKEVSYQTQRATSFELTLSDKIQDIANTDLIYSRFLTPVALQEQKDQALKFKRINQMLVLSNIVTIIIFLVIILSVIFI